MQDKYRQAYESDGFVDLSSYFSRARFNYHNICGPKGAGKSMLLSALCCYYDDQVKTGDMFTDCDLSKTEGRQYDKGQHPVIDLDFSDYAATDMEGAYAYFRSKMSELYLRMWGRCTEEIRYYSSCERYLNVVDGSCNIDELEYSLRSMVSFLRCYSRNGNRPLILIDEAGRPVLYADHYGYKNEFRKFYDRFLDIDHYEQDFGIVTTSFAPVNTDVDYGLKYIRDVPVNEVFPLREVCRLNNIDIQVDYEPIHYFAGTKYFRKSVNMEECFDAQAEQEGGIKENNVYPIMIEEKEKTLICRKRSWVEKSKIEEEIENRRREERCRMEYAADLPDDCHIPSIFAGMRELHLTVKNHEKLDRLNDLLIDLYDRYQGEIRQRDVYRVIQNYSDDADVKVNYQMEELIHQNECDPSWKIRTKRDSYWERFDCERGDKYQHNDLTLVKAYLSLPDMGLVCSVFRNVIQFLLSEGTDRFHAKAARQMRADQICLWVTREDFFRLESFIEKDNTAFVQPLPFVAYRGKIGISRELHSWDSHNGVQASLISAYLSEVQDRKAVSLIDMYTKYVRAWNGDLNKDSKLTREFKESNAQEFIILLESINCIIGDGHIGDDHILLNGDSKLWEVLGESRNWYEVGEHSKCDS